MATASPDIYSLLESMPIGQIQFILDKELAERDFSEFCRLAWDVVEPGRPLVWGWHLQAKCDHLQAVYNFSVPVDIDPVSSSQVGIQNFIVNEPPRCAKSLFDSVFFPAWVWTKWLGARFLCVTYADDLAQRDALKTRQLIESDWYQARWPLKIADDQRAKSRYNLQGWDADSKGWKDSGGFRVSTTILGIATGEGADFRILDDPHNVKKALSDVERQQANTFIDLTLPTRVVDPEKSSTVICMQRLHQDDATGHVLDGETKWDHLCLPMEYEKKEGNRCRTALGFVDPRTEDGELLHPERWTRRAVDKAKGELRMSLGEFGVNSQFQQRPTPPGGGMFQPANIILVPAWPPLHDLERIVRYWDKAGSEGTGAYTSGVLMAKRKSTQRTIILDVVRGQWGTDKREMIIQETAYQDIRRLNGNSKAYHVRLEQEPGSGGKDSAIWTVRETLKGINAAARVKKDSKEVDWRPFAAQVNLGGIEMVHDGWEPGSKARSWNKELKQEMEAAPFGKFKDQVDAGSGGFWFIWLAPTFGVIG
jgi:phage terminase large subunit-like protein